MNVGTSMPVHWSYTELMHSFADCYLHIVAVTGGRCRKQPVCQLLLLSLLQPATEEAKVITKSWMNASVKNNYKSPLLCFSCWHLMIFFCTSLPTWWTPLLLPFPYRPSFLFSILEDYCTQAVLQEACVWFSIYTAKIPTQTDTNTVPWIHESTIGCVLEKCCDCRSFKISLSCAVIPN